MKIRKVLILDLTDCKSSVQLHERIRATFHFPESYTANWDSFFELLCSSCDADEVMIIGESTVSKDYRVQLAIMHDVLLRYKQLKQQERKKSKDAQLFDYRVVN